MSQAATPSGKKAKSPRQVLLGLFILFQLAFLVISNVLGFVKSIPEHAPDAPAELLDRAAPHLADAAAPGWKQIDSNLKWWAELTGQDQQWALFAPTVARGAAFPCVLVLWDEPVPKQPGLGGVLLAFDPAHGWRLPDDATVPRSRLLLSENEPEDVNSFFRSGKCRLRRYEGHLWVNPRPQPDDTPDLAAARMTERVRTLRDQYGDVAHAYLRWRVDSWMHERPGERDPTQVILCQRYYRINTPEEGHGWDGPSLIPLVRWQPAVEGKRVEAFDFVEQRFRP